MVEESETMFSYAADGSKTYADFNFPNFVPSVFTDELRNMSMIDWLNQTYAEELCNGNEFCLFDYLATRSSDVALSTVQQQKDFKRSVQAMCKFIICVLYVE